MITMTAAAAAAVTRSYRVQIRGEVWLDGELLAADVPISAATEDDDDSLNVPERVTLTVPRLDRGVSWSPGADVRHPLAPFGQQIRLSLGIDVGNGQVEWLQRGWFLIAATRPQGDAISVEALGLLALIQEARFVSPFQPSGTFATTLRKLIEPALTATIDSGLTDRAVPSSLAWDQDRIESLGELLDAWPADARMAADGHLNVTPDPVAGPGVLALTDGAGGTVVRWLSELDRDGAFTTVVARGTAADGGVVQGVAYDRTGGPLDASGPFNPLPVPYLYSSPLLITVAQCRSAAAHVLARLRRRSSRRLAAELVPHPGLQTGDVVTVTGEGLKAAPCVIDALTLPYNADAGAQTLTVRVL